MNGIATFAQGQFQTLALGSDWVLVGSFSKSIPDIIGDYRAGRQLPHRYLNPAAFDFPNVAQGNRIRAVGNAGRNSLQQPGLNNWDLGVFKNIRFTERIQSQIRWETFNTWNHAQFGSANLSITNPNFGRILGTRVGARRMQLGLKVSW